MSASADKASSASTPSFISALILGLVIFGALLVVWFALHGKDMRLFQPRTMLPPVGARAPDLPNSPLAWFKGVVMAPDSLVLEAQGPDAYFFLRFIRLGVLLFAVFFVITWVILMPIVGTGSGGLLGLDRFTFGNIGLNQQPRIIAYLLVAIVLTLWVIYLVDVEYKHYRIVRQQWLSSEARAGLPETRTVVIVNVPATYMTVEGISELASDCGTVQKVWLTRAIDDLEEIYEARNKEVGILEGSEGSVLALAAKNVKKNKLPDPKNAATVEADDLIGQYILKKKQPSHKRGFLGLFGAKVDTLNDSPAYIQTKEEELATARAGVDSLKLGDTAFIRFATRQQAHAFVSSIGSGKSTTKALKKIKGEVEVMPEDVFWANTLKSHTSRTIGGILGWTLTIFLIIIWAIPVALVGFISNIDNLTEKVKFLSFLKSLPSVVIGIIQGVLPPVLLAVLFMLLPIVLRKFVKMGGPVLKSQIELQLFSRFWLFQVIHGFLIVTLASGLIGALYPLNAEIVKTLPTLLSTKLPTAATFFLQYLALYALTSFGLSVSRTVPFVMSKLGSLLSGPTPRKEWRFQDKMMAIALATTWPPVALLLCVGIVYSCIQPVITIFGMFTFALLYIMYKYILIWVADQPDSLETGGEFMRKGFMTIFVSLYLELICLAGLFFLSKDTSGSQSKEGLASGAIMVVLIVFVAVFHWMSSHKRQNARECHFLDGSLHPNSSKTVINDRDEAHGSPSTYPPTSKEKEAGAVFANTSGTGMHEQAFDHPALWKAAPIVWMADDSLGIAKKEAARLNELKVEASTEFATMDADGKIEVVRCAPDEAWQEGINAI